MPTAIVLINTEIGAEQDVFDELARIDTVKEAYIVYGVYDIVARLEADTMDELKDAVANNIRKLPKVRSTLTMIVIEGKEFRK